MNTLKRKIKQHQLINSLITLKGNPKALVLMEPLWGIPFYLIAPFATLYMQAKGITDIQIGLILSVTTALQMVACALSGVVTDKFGRKRITMFGDVMGWGIPCLIWAVSGNLWMFLIAAMINSVEKIGGTAWYCFLSEDVEPDKLVNIWNWVFIAGNISVFFAPIAGLLIGKTSLISVMKIMYFIFAACMAVKAIVTYRCTKETKRGVIRKAETKNQSIISMLREYEALIPQTLKNKKMIYTLAIIIALQCTNIITVNFFALYATSTLGVSDGMIAIFPIFKAAMMLIFFFVAPQILEKISLEIPMFIGTTFYIFCQLILIFCPPGNLLLLLVYALVDAVAFALVIPRKETMVVNYVDEKERARVLGLLTMLSLVASIPCGYIAGWLSSHNRQYPFLLNLAMFVTMAIVLAIGWLQKRKVTR